LNFPPIEKQLKVIKSGVENLISEEELVQKLKRCEETGKPLRVKQGFDPTAPDIHLGHTVGLRKLRQFQDLGHKVVLIIGDYTGMVGDPSGRSDTRPRLTYEQVVENAKTYEKQFFKILDKNKTEVRYNGEWFSKMTFSDVMDLAARFTVARLLERDDFANRYKEGKPISLHEFFYPLMQGYDSVAIQADVELGATEQLFNLVAARQIQKEYGQEPQVVITLPVLEGIDGKQRMSKSLGNYIGIDEESDEMFGKVMSIPDNLILKYFTLVTDYDIERLKDVERRLNDKTVNPMEVKKELARTIVAMYYGEEAALAAQRNFEKVFSRREIPDGIQEVKVESNNKLLVNLLAEHGILPSKSECRRLIRQGAIEVNKEKISDINFTLEKNKEYIVKVGKRKFVKFIT